MTLEEEINRMVEEILRCGATSNVSTLPPPVLDLPAIFDAINLLPPPRPIYPCIEPYDLCPAPVPLHSWRWFYRIPLLFDL